MPARVPIRGLGRNEGAYDRYIAATDLPLTLLALLWLPVLLVPYVVNLSPAMSETFNVIDFAVWGAFAFDYLTRLYLVPARRHFFTHHIFDLAVVVLPMLRPLRAFRLLRLFNLARVGVIATNALRRTRAVLTHRGLHYVLLVALVILFACAGLVLGFERNAHGSNIHNYGQALWWGIVTITTVGYGDTFPVTAGGRGVAIVLMLVGIGLLGVVTASVASFFVQQDADDDKAELVERLDRIEGMLAQVLGTGTTAKDGAQTLRALDEAPDHAAGP